VVLLPVGSSEPRTATAAKVAFDGDSYAEGRAVWALRLGFNRAKAPATTLRRSIAGLCRRLMSQEVV
jgi:hypothetical protein